MSFRGALDDVPSVMLLMNCHRWVVITLNPEPSTRALPLDTPWGLLCPRLPMPPTSKFWLRAPRSRAALLKTDTALLVCPVSDLSPLHLCHSFIHLPNRSEKFLGKNVNSIRSIVLACLWKKRTASHSSASLDLYTGSKKGETRRLAVTSST